MTIREALNRLPNKYKQRAFANVRQLNGNYKLVLNRRLEDEKTAVSLAFIWNTTPEGFAFWSEVSTALRKGIPLPPIPDSSI